jgi:hypothetical protein
VFIGGNDNFLMFLGMPLARGSSLTDRKVSEWMYTELCRESQNGNPVYDNAPGNHIFLFGDSDDRKDLFERTFTFLAKQLKP